MSTVTVYVDVDGVLNAFGGWLVQRDEWLTDKMGRAYNRRTAPEGFRAAHAGGYSLLLNPQHPEWLAEIEAAGAEVVWSTMWVDRAITEFAPVFGWGSHLEYVDFHAYHDPEAWRNAARVGMGVGSYKLPGWVAVNNGTDPIVIIDDDLEPVVYDWAARREALGGPTLLIQPDPAVGLTREHVDQILAFARDLEPTLAGAH